MFNNRDTVESLREALYSMETQLIALYEEKQQGNNEQELTQLRETVANFEEQLASLYYDRETAGTTGTVAPASEVTEMVDNLESQVKSLIDEKMDLEEKILKFSEEKVEMQKRARDLGSALFEAAIVGRMQKVV